MVKRKPIVLVALLVLALTVGCNPYRFKVETKMPVDGRIFSDYNSVDPHLYGFDMHPNAVVNMSSLAWTQFDLAFYLRISGGDGFQLLLRPVSEETVVDSGLVLTFRNSGGMRLDSAGHLIDEKPSFRFPQDSQIYVTIYNEESYLQVTVGCDTVVKRYTKQKSSDDVVLKTLPGSELHVLDPEWNRVRFEKNFDVKTETAR